MEKPVLRGIRLVFLRRVDRSWTGCERGFEWFPGSAFEAGAARRG